MNKIFALIVAAAMSLLSFEAAAQNTFPTGGGGGPRVNGYVEMCLDGSGFAIPKTSAGQCGGGGGGGSPGGLNGQIQYNNSGAFGGITGATTDGTTLSLVAPNIGTPASGDATNLVNIPAGNLTGTIASGLLTGAYGGITGVGTLTSLTIGAGSAITSSGPGGALGSNAFNSTSYLPLAGGTMSGSIAMGGQNITGGGTGAFASVALSGTAGAGYLEIPNQSAAPGTPTAAGRLYWDASNRLSWIGTNGFTRSFDGTANTASRVYTLPDAAATIAGINIAQTWSGNQTNMVLVTPTLGAATATSINKMAITAPATSSTLAVADGKTATFSNTLTFAGTDGSTLNVGTGGTLGTAAFQNTGTSGANVPLLNGANTFSGATIHSANVTLSSAALISSGAISSAAWTTNGLRLQMGAASYTDTSSSGTVANAYSDLYGATTILASSATTYTNYYGAYFVAPIASTNVTMTNKSALGADSISVGGANQSTFALAVTGTASISGALTANPITSSGSITAGAVNSYAWTGRGILTSPTTGSVQEGGTDVDTNASIVAQTLRSQGALAGGTADQAGKNWTFIASPGKGTGAGGSFVWQTSPAGTTGTSVNAPVTALTINSAALATFAGQVAVTAMTQTAVAQSGTVCYNSGTGAITYDATVGCLTSTMEEKDNWQNITPEQALSVVLQMQAGSFNYKKGRGLPDGEQIGLSAQQIAPLDDRLVAYDASGKLRGVRYQQASALYPMAIQALKADNDNLRQELRRAIGGR